METKDTLEQEKKDIKTTDIEKRLTLPSLFGESMWPEMPEIFENGFHSPFSRMIRDCFNNPTLRLTKKVPEMLRTDIAEADGKYVIKVDLPGCAKEDVKAELADGYLTISADRASDMSDGLRRERYAGHSERSFYVGNKLKQEDIKGKLENGVLTLTFDKTAAVEMPEKSVISIE